MNTPNPLIPQGTLDRQSKGKSTVRIAIFTIISIHAVFFAGLLMQGCRPDAAKAGGKVADASTNQNTLPSIDPGYYPSTQDVAQPTNPLPSNNLASGTVSEAVTPLPTAVLPEPPSDGKPYTVAKGDTFLKIAKANGVSVGAMTKANPSVDPGKLKPGQKIQIPAASAPTTAGIGFKEPPAADSASTPSQTHTVKPGDTLTKIAKQHGTTVKAIRAVNNLKTDRLVAGQKIKLPAAHLAHATGDAAKTATVSKLSATHPAPGGPLANTSNSLAPR